MRPARRPFPALVVFALGAAAVTTVLGVSGGSAAAAPTEPVMQGAERSAPVAHALSGPVRDMPGRQVGDPVGREHAPKRLPMGPQSQTADPALQATATTTVASASVVGVVGVGSGDLSFVPDAAPPDTTGAVGTTEYVQWANESFAVFDKSGTPLTQAIAGNTLFKNLGGTCALNNDGDPIVQFDKQAKRWVLTQFAVTSTPYTQCVAVSQTEDARGAFNLYAYGYGNQFNDYPKVGIWPDGYYTTYNIFTNGQTFAGTKVCAWDRVAMLAGATSPAQQCFQLSTAYGGLLPADVDGTTSPPAGSPNYLLNFGTNSLRLWKFHVDWNDSSQSTLTGPSTIAVPAFTSACGGGACIPQPGTNQKLDSLADRLMYRLAYRNFGDHEALVANHSVKVSGTSSSQVDGIRWYELRNPATNATLYQSGTYSPDSTSRWMGSIAMDHVGNIALGYSASSSSVLPSIRFTGRAPNDALGTLAAERTLKAGGGSQLQTLSRWGDYTHLSVDPVDDCTFWYTAQYLKSSGTFNWSTWIASFTLSGCATTTQAPPGTPSLVATAGNGSVALSWSPGSGSAPTSYTLYRRSGGGPATVLTTTAGTSYTDNAVTNGVDYYYGVSATNSAGTSATSQDVLATPTAPPSAPVAAFTYSCGNSNCSFDGSTSTNAVSYGWAFGDGATGSGVTSTHGYTRTGTFPVVLTASSGTQTSTATKSVTCISAKGRNKITCG
ncbi:MAG: hypothetical protein JWO88_434 [Frankiales bacterium]|nr:hypothetical protein [Frankiales bacterium]